MAADTAAGWLDGRIDALREHIVALAAAAPTVPAELARVQERIAQETAARGHGMFTLLALSFLALGVALEVLFRHATPARTPAHRLKAIAWRFVRDLGAVAAFALGSVAAFLAFDWPVHTRGAVLALLTVIVALRLAYIVSRAVFSPTDAQPRVIPLDDGAARFWHVRAVLFAGWLALGWMIAVRLAAHGMPDAPRAIVVYAMGLGLLALAVEAVWRRSRAAVIALLVVWLLWVLGLTGLFWLAVIALTLPPILRQLQAGADHVMRPAHATAAEGRGVPAAALGRGLRALAIIGAAALLAHAFSLNVDTVAAGDTVWMRLLRGAVHALVIVLVADLVWLVAASLIDQKLARDADNARVRTLLPIVRGAVAAVLIVMAVLMALSALGVEVGALLASAGVVGIALGFGAQTLVRDLLSKFFYLFDDAFRIGEYIQSGNYKGTVEHLGARSVRLRHHRGPVYTIPYGQLGAVQNQSRDWVIDKLTIGLTYDADLEKARKLIKKIGQELAQNPEFAPNILEPLKMQGVEQFGDFAIQVRMKMKTRPGEQFVIRRKAYAMIKAAFDANGIHFAYPTVQVAGGAADAGAVAAVREGLNKLSEGKAP